MLDAGEKATLAQLCDTLIPALQAETGDDPRLFALCAADLDLAERIEAIIAEVATDDDIRLLRLFLRVIEIGLFNRLTAGQAGAFSRLSLEQRTNLLRKWAESRFPIARRAFQSLKRLSLAVFYAVMPDEQPNPTWAALRYDDPPGRAERTPRTIRLLEISEATTLDTDVLVIGSGAGGGVVAGELSAAGLDVIVAEKGRGCTEADFHGREYASSEQLYERRALLTTADQSVSLLAGSTLGGGTTVNWTTSLRPPESLLHQWAQEYGFSGAAGAAFQRSLDAVSQRIHVNTGESQPNALNALLEAGCRQLGYAVGVLPRNVQGCVDCGFCGYGCPFGAKQGTLRTYLQDAFERGARILARAHVDRVLVQQGTAQGAAMTVTAVDGQVYPVIVRARAVVVAAGAVHTPALLRRSGLGNAHIGANLHLHPTTVIFSQFADPVIGWRGTPQSRLCDQFVDLDGRGYGVRLETAPIHPGLAASAFPWLSGAAHKRHMQRIAHYANIIIITRDYYSGRVTVDRRGQPVLRYRLQPYDARHMRRGLIEAIRIHAAAGATVIYGPHQGMDGYRAGLGDSLEAFLRRVRGGSFAPNALGLFSAHQMSTCRVGGSSALGAINPEGETYEVRNLFVADASVFPTASGVNPMLTVMGTAHYLAQAIRSRLA
jgi:choline dehydrogenase-like flavoprotein